MSKFKFKGIAYLYTCMIPEELVDDFNKNAKDEDSFTMYGDKIMSYKGRIYCKESDNEIWNTMICRE